MHPSSSGRNYVTDFFIIDAENENEWQSEAKLYTALEVRPNRRLRLQTVEGTGSSSSSSSSSHSSNSDGSNDSSSDSRA